MSAPDFFRSWLDQMIDLRHPLAVLATRLPWAAIDAALAPRRAHQAKPAKWVIGDDLAGAFESESGGGISPAGRPRPPPRQTSCRLHIHADDPRRSDTTCQEINTQQSFKNRH